MISINNRATEPYTDPRAECINREYGRFLMSLYAGRNGEISAVCGYIYQSIILENSEPKLSEALDLIAMDEMRHFKLLGSSIASLGIDPKLSASGQGNENAWRNREYVNYIEAPEEIIRNNITSERTAIADYHKAALLISDERINKLLSRIIRDEERHVEIVSALLAEYSSQK